VTTFVAQGVTGIFALLQASDVLLDGQAKVS
jgi:hypothetical protein